MLELHERQVLNYIGNYDYYLEKRDVLRTAQLKETSVSKEAAAAEPLKETGGKEDWKQKKQKQAAQRRLENELHKVESRIEQLETEKAQLEEEMAKPEVAVISAKVMELHTMIRQKEEELESLYDRWEELTND